MVVPNLQNRGLYFVFKTFFSLFVLLSFTVFALTANSESKNLEGKIPALGSGDTSNPTLRLPVTYAGQIPKTEVRDTTVSYWRADWRAGAKFRKQQESGKKCFQLSWCRAGMLHFSRIMRNFPTIKYLLKSNTVISLLMPGTAGDPHESKIVENEKRKRAAVLNAGSQARVFEKSPTNEGKPSETGEFVIILPPGTDPQDVELSPDYEVEVLRKILPQGSDPKDHEINHLFEKTILNSQPKQSDSKTPRPAGSFDNGEPPDIYDLPEGEETPQWVKDNYELLDGDDHPEMEIIDD